MAFSEEQVNQLAPDDASAQAGRKLAAIIHWETLNQHTLALWGECKGSGKLPYFVKIDLANLAYACTCPSRKFPCKHALGLLYLYARDSSKINQSANLHPSVEEWLHKREQKTTAKESKPATIVDEKGKQKRAVERTTKVNDGIVDLQQWLNDLMRTGISIIPQQKYQYFQNIAARLVDAQANGLANQVRQLGEINYQSADWHEQFLNACSYIYALAKAYGNVVQLDEIWKNELQVRVGWNISKDEVNAQTPIRDTWIILGIERKTLDKLISEKIWIYGIKSDSIRYILNFIANAQAPRQLFAEGTAVTGTAYPYPVLETGRVLMEETNLSQVNWSVIKGSDVITSIGEIVCNALANNPFISEIPVILHKVSIWRQEQFWWIFDSQGNAMRLNNSESEIIQLLASHGGHPFSCLSIWIDKQLHVVSHWADGTFYALKG